MSSKPAPGRLMAAAPIILVVSLFFLWGMANNLNDVLIAQFRKAFTLGDLQSGLVQSAFYFGYFVLAVPAALFMKRFGYKRGVVLGLILFGIGALMFWPAAEVRRYEMFLLALFVIASGLAFLETSANPLVTVLGPPETAERRLNLAQAFNPLGSIVGLVIGRQFILSGVEHTPEQLAALPPDQLAQFYATEATAVQAPYLVIGLFVLAWAGLVLLTPFPRVAGVEAAREEGPGSARDFGALLRNRRYLLGVVAQFFYVGAQVGVWSFMIRYAQEGLAVGERTAADYLTWSIVAFMVGRFAGTALMTRVKPALLLTVFGLINVALCIVAVAAPGPVGMIALASTSFFMSIMFPTIFASSLKGLGGLTKAGSSLLVMAIIGGAVLTALMGLVSDASSIHIAMVVPAACFAVVALFGWRARREAA
ncbi:L-fucose:H+ symporter permease [Brevundimonas sp. Root1279]|uniref:L-fucose:H+ symporter permease n=1 Tax=Brevundimonas sp. Root1279 TaxID=1736443 RepID=UPI0006FC2AB6|nr:L-fucose:H+ symporter permease [Brevundimonas sp. Root1279]KQW80788.1 fucose permease [Brevundimonas sp. Root1279]